MPEEGGVFRLDVTRRAARPDAHLLAEAAAQGLGHVDDLLRSRYYLLRGELAEDQVLELGRRLLADPINEALHVDPPPTDGRRVIEVQKKPGVMDPAESSIVKAARDLGIPLEAVRVGERVTTAKAGDAELETIAWKCLANRAIEEVAIDPERPVRFPRAGGDATHARKVVPLIQADDAELERISAEGCLSLDLVEMRTIRDHFHGIGREPTDVELESLAQTWSEHCVHKTLKGDVDYRGPDGDRRIENLLGSTIARATEEIDADWCLSVFKDNSGIVEFDNRHGVCIKVETHNHPSAIEPYGGANTGLGGVIRDILGTGLGARPIFNTDVFCFGLLDTPDSELPRGTIHPRTLMKGVVAGVRDYGNRMGIPTVNGAVRFDRRYVGNPLVFCGTAGLIPREFCQGEAEEGDHILLVGGRTGRDGIHGATFSSAELSTDSETASSGAVQIGNPIEEKRVADTWLRARDAGCFSATTDCGAGGISSAIGEMGEELGCAVHLDRVPLKYEGLSYAEIWISEAQERMVAAVPPAKLDEALAIFASENVEATDLGTFTGDRRLRLYHHGEEVADLDMGFLHDGLPKQVRNAVFKGGEERAATWYSSLDLDRALVEVLARPNVASKEWVIRQYDHEVQAGSIVKPLVGPGRDAPSDAAVVTPQLGRDRGVAVACGINTCYGDVDAYHAACAGIEEALRNLACVGADLERVALLDNFSWGNCDRAENMGALVRACQACYDCAVHYGTPFVSGKDSLNNEFVQGGETIVIPHTLLITAMTVVEDVTGSVTMDVKHPGDLVVVIGATGNELGGSEYLALVDGKGGIVPRLDLETSSQVLGAVTALTREGLVTAAHDCSDGGLAVCLAEMAFGGGFGMRIDLDRVPCGESLPDLATLCFSESLSRIVVTVPELHRERIEEHLAGVPHAILGEVTDGDELQLAGRGQNFAVPVHELKLSWRRGLAVLEEG